MQKRYLQNLERNISVKQYTVQITDEAIADMEQLYNYIAYNLLSPENTIEHTKLNNLLSIKEITQPMIINPIKSCVILSFYLLFPIPTISTKFLRIQPHRFNHIIQPVIPE